MSPTSSNVPLMSPSNLLSRPNVYCTITRAITDYRVLSPGEYLNDTIIDFYLKYLLSQFNLQAQNAQQQQQRK